MEARETAFKASGSGTVTPPKQSRERSIFLSRNQRRPGGDSTELLRLNAMASSNMSKRQVGSDTGGVLHLRNLGVQAAQDPSRNIQLDMANAPIN
eukprot:435399-Heterocapsa_arctica.AAC.1